MSQPLQPLFGQIDIYLFDQVLRGRLQKDMAILDAGCGGGRNLVYLMQSGYDVWAVDQDERAIRQVVSIASQLAPDIPGDRFAVAPVEAMPFPDATFDFVICNAVLHFARDEAHFRAMIAEIARVLRPGGILFTRLMSTHGVESLVQPIGNRRHVMPGGAEAFLVDEKLLREMTTDVLKGELMDPLKSTIVHGERTMSTWVVRRK